MIERHPFTKDKILTLEDMILEANRYGLPFNFLLNFSYGELSRYIEFHRDKERLHYQNLSSIAYRQAMLTACAVAGTDVGEIYDVFPYWSEDEILDIQARKVMEYFKNID